MLDQTAKVNQLRISLHLILFFATFVCLAYLYTADIFEYKKLTFRFFNSSTTKKSESFELNAEYFASKEEEIKKIFEETDDVTYRTTILDSKRVEEQSTTPKASSTKTVNNSSESLLNHQKIAKIENLILSDMNLNTNSVSRWMPMVQNQSGCCFIYSAYFDSRPEFFQKYFGRSKNNREGGLIKVMSIAKAELSRGFKCHLKYSETEIISKEAAHRSLPEEHDAKFSLYFIFCEIKENEKLPEFVGISENTIDESSIKFVNFVKISYSQREHKSGDFINEIALCPGPVTNNFNDTLRIAEMIEIYKILGVSKFYIYNTSMSDDVTKLLKFYESQGTVEIFQWNVLDILEVENGTNEIDDKTIHYYGIMGVLNDCFTQATQIDRFKYFIHADCDEIIFSYKFDTLTEFLQVNDAPEFHSFSFDNFFFFSTFKKDFSNVPKYAVNKFLYTQAQTTKKLFPNNHHERSKYIAKADSVYEVGNHFVWEEDELKREFMVDTLDGAVHHYREGCVLHFCKDQTDQNDYARKYAAKLWKRVDKVCLKVFDGKCPR